MKAIILALTLTSASAFGGSLDAELAKQTTVKISPVEVQGQETTQANAPHICKILGYTRLVTFETKQSKIDGKFFGVSMRPDHVTMIDLDAILSPGHSIEVLDSVTCAR